MKNKRLLKVAGYYVLEFILFFLIFALTLLLIMKFTFFNDAYIKNKLKHNNYYAKITNLIISDSKDYLISSGLKDSILDNVFIENDITNEINSMLESLINNTSYTVNSKVVEERLEKNISDYLKKQNLAITNKESLNNFVKQICNVYEINITLSNLPDIVRTVFKYVFKYLNILFISISSLIILIILTIKFVYKKRSIIVIPLVSSALLYFFLALYISNSVDIANMIIFTDAFSNLLRDMLFAFLKYLNAMAIFMFLTAINIRIIKLKIRFMNE